MIRNMTSAKSRVHGNVRYRALYVTLPFANGAVLAASYVALYGVIGTPESWIATSPVIDAPLVQYIGSMALWLVGLISAIIVICYVDLLALEKVYGLKLLSFAKELRGTPGYEKTIGIGVVVSTMITPLGSTAIIIVANGMSVLPVPAIPSMSEFVISPIIAGAVLGRAYLPALNHGEEAMNTTL